ncbi:halo-CC-star protein HcsL [Halococcus sp. AFM35]|uniref:halo-CC-star protein HcsL n=1 Tax=Halococcus sp. AFM35 TaxID=3421653 RepID=UPI003EBE8340
MSEVQSEGTAVEAELRTFIETLTDSGTYQQFSEASEALKNDPEASALLQDFQQKQQQMQLEEFDQSVMSELKGLQTEIADNETIQRQQASQEELTELLQKTNDIISDRIGQEFAQSTGGGCC